MWIKAIRLPCRQEVSSKRMQVTNNPKEESTPYPENHSTKTFTGEQ